MLLLNLEGFNKKYEWHVYLYCDKYKLDNMFIHHYIRKNLITTWTKYLKRTDKRRPLWISPLEIINIHVECGKEWTISYKDLLIGGKGVKKSKEVENLPLSLDWFQYKQLKNLFDIDRNKYGFKVKNSEFEEIILKIISNLRVINY